MEMDETEIARARTHALDRANILSRLLDERYFADIAVAMKSKNEELFKQTCKKAAIADEIIENLWKLMEQHGVTYDDILW